MTVLQFSCDIWLGVKEGPTQPISLAHNGARPGLSKQWKDTVMGQASLKTTGTIVSTDQISCELIYSYSVIFLN